jgi:excisionase family DNA binding protein
MTGLLSPADAAGRLGVSIDTLRRWVAEGRLSEHRTPGGHRRLDETEVEELQRATPSGATSATTKPSGRRQRRARGVVGYARAHPGDDWKASLAAQVSQLRDHGCDEVVTEVGSGLAELRPGLSEVIQWVAAGDVGEVVVITPDRIGSTNVNVVSQVLAALGGRLTILEPAMSDSTTRAELTAELRSIVSSYANRLYGPGDLASKVIKAVDTALVANGED